MELGDNNNVHVKDTAYLVLGVVAVCGSTVGQRMSRHREALLPVAAGILLGIPAERASELDSAQMFRNAFRTRADTLSVHR